MTGPVVNTWYARINATAAVNSIIPITQMFLTVEEIFPMSGHRKAATSGMATSSAGGICDDEISKCHPWSLRISLISTVPYFFFSTIANERTSALVATPITIDVSVSA